MLNRLPRNGLNADAKRLRAVTPLTRPMSPPCGQAPYQRHTGELNGELRCSDGACRVEALAWRWRLTRAPVNSQLAHVWRRRGCLENRAVLRGADLSSPGNSPSATSWRKARLRQRRQYRSRAISGSPAEARRVGGLEWWAERCK